MKDVVKTGLQGLLELFLLLLYPLISIFRSFLIDNSINKNSIQPYAIIIFEQWLVKNPMHMLMKKFLENKGYRVYWANYSIVNGGIDDGAKFLQRFISQYKLHNITLVGISMGAISSLYYLQNYNGWKKVRKFISIGGPFKGTPWANLLRFTKAGRQIVPDSKFINNLLGKQIRNPENIICISARYDQLVPSWSSRLPGVKNIISQNAGHNYLHIISPFTIDTIVHYAAK